MGQQGTGGMNRDSGGAEVSRYLLYGPVSESRMPGPAPLPRLCAIESKNPVNRRNSAAALYGFRLFAQRHPIGGYQNSASTRTGP
jgi:hypothetical protein